MRGSRSQPTLLLGFACSGVVPVIEQRQFEFLHPCPQSVNLIGGVPECLSLRRLVVDRVGEAVGQVGADAVGLDEPQLVGVHAQTVASVASRRPSPLTRASLHSV